MLGAVGGQSRRPFDGNTSSVELGGGIVGGFGIQTEEDGEANAVLPSITEKVMSEQAGIYKVNVFVNVPRMDSERVDEKTDKRHAG